MARINVTKTFLPPIEEYEAQLNRIWENDWLTNQGPLLQEFERAMKQHLKIDNFHFVSNGTIALQVALKALDITEGEVITTPFSYVATTSSILWERCTPVFVDIDPQTLCMDADRIEAAITEKTRAIMPVHVFGNPCDTEKIGAIAKKHNLKVIYDAAHAFNVEYKGKSLLDYGDISICSFHATKLFHTIEGGALTVRDTEVNEKVDLIKRFGHNGDNHYRLGINAKASEFQAAMGLTNLKYIETNAGKRKAICDLYDKLVTDKLERPLPPDGTKRNHGYYPVIFPTETMLLATIEALNAKDIYPRRYFYPSLNQLPYIQNTEDCPISVNIASRILCLPLYSDLSHDDVETIASIVNQVHGV